MKTPKEQAEELVEQYVQALIDNSNWDAITSDGVVCAIKAVEHTIEVLESLNQPEFRDFVVINEAINQQTEILTELKAKL